MDNSSPPSPINPLPPVVVALFLVIVGIEVIFWAGANQLVGDPTSVSWRRDAILTYGFSADVLKQMWVLGQWPVEHLIRFVTYPFVHGAFTHAVFSGVILLAMGKMVAEVFGPWPMLAVFVASGIGGALGYTVFLDQPIVLFGAFPSVYGLIGAFTFILWRSLSLVGANQMRAFSLIGFLMGFQLLFVILFDAQSDWVADLSGFATGFLLSFVVAPGGWAALLDRLRKR
mgnify:CR=1 FL=1